MAIDFNRFNVPNRTLERTGSLNTVSYQKDVELKKPDLNELKNLYTIWVNSEITYVPAAEASASVKQRTEKLEKYAKAKNLDINVQNLELFFNYAKGKIPQSDNMLGTGLLTVLNEYIESGYNYQPDLSGLKSDLINGINQVRQDYLALQNKIEKEKTDLINQRNQLLQDYLANQDMKLPKIDPDIMNALNAMDKYSDVFNTEDKSAEDSKNQIQQDLMNIKNDINNYSDVFNTEDKI